MFLPGEREIRDTAEALAPLAEGIRGIDVLPLFSRLSAAEQHRVFAPAHGSRRRVVLATNVAETSLTVPGIRYVVDTGVARISRYSARTKVQRLPIEPISRASANQRSGRCGRVAAGIAIRLYSEEDFEARPEFTDPEILRTNLASVILQMTSLGLGDIARFPFVEPPDRRNVQAGVQAARGDPGRCRGSRSSPRPAAAWPGSRSTPGWAGCCWRPSRLGCVRDVLVIVAALSLQDPRERPGAEQPKERAHADQPACPLQGRGLGLPHPAQPDEPPAPAAEGGSPAAPSAGCASGSTSTTCGCASGRSLVSQAAPGHQGDGPAAGGAHRHPRRRRHPPGTPVRPALARRRAGGAGEAQAGCAQGRPAPRPAGVPRRARRQVRDLPRQRPGPAEPALRDGRRGWSRPAGCGPGRTPRSSRSGPSGSARTWSSGPTPSRTGRAGGRR
ncbi:helicase-related protein [Nocardioides convexus]|uniref:helicase-related protein n=1 Tax=Nocardioides convexus TaxID=2712224 RepID=UPI0031013615